MLYTFISYVVTGKHVPGIGVYVIVALPCEFDVITPELLICATAILLLLQVPPASDDNKVGLSPRHI